MTMRRIFRNRGGVATLDFSLALGLGLVLALPGCGGGGGGGGAGSSASSGANAAADYPTKTITVICPWAAGGGTDRLSRFMADHLQRELGKPAVVVNRTGGKGAVGHVAGSSARPDGHTITMGTFELSTMHWMGISPLTHRDFTPVMQLNADAAAIIVKRDAPWAELKQFLDHVRATPKKVTMSGTATGGAWDLARAGLFRAAGIDVGSVIWVPSQGAAPSLTELLGGHVDAVCCSLPEAAAQLENGELRALVVMADERLPAYPDVATVKEQGIEWSAVGWRGLLLPLETPQAVVDKIVATCQTIVEGEAFKDFMGKNGFEIEIKGPEDFAAFLAQQDAQWKEVIEAVGYAAEP